MTSYCVIALMQERHLARGYPLFNPGGRGLNPEPCGSESTTVTAAVSS